MDRTRKPVLVFGDNNSKSVQEEGERGGSNSTSCKKLKPTYNHCEWQHTSFYLLETKTLYKVDTHKNLPTDANGSGFWDCDMEGVDSEEVGHSEVWEGVGSTTFGDIVDWH